MSKTHQFLVRKPFDLYQLHLFRLVAESGSFTQAARASGLTQSAISRQIQALEHQLGVILFQRTTREVIPTAAGSFLFQESGTVLGDVDSLIRRLRVEHAEAPREVRVGVSRSVSLAYLPGFFARNTPGSIISRVSHDMSSTILELLETDQLDIGVLVPPPRLSPRLRITHRFTDAFTFIANRDRVASGKLQERNADSLRDWIEGQPWLALHSSTETGLRLTAWLKQERLVVVPAMELDNFDLIINLVALGLGVSLVPQRALALYNRRRSLVRLPWNMRFSRELVVLVRRQRTTPEHIRQFTDKILF